MLRFALVALASACCWAATRKELDLTTVVTAIVVVTAVAVVRSPQESRDVWSYVEYGRMLVFHGVSPYTHTVSEFRHDPFFARAGWHRTPSFRISQSFPLGSPYAPTQSVLSRSSSNVKICKPFSSGY